MLHKKCKNSKSYKLYPPCFLLFPSKDYQNSNLIWIILDAKIWNTNISDLEEDDAPLCAHNLRGKLAEIGDMRCVLHVYFLHVALIVDVGPQPSLM